MEKSKILHLDRGSRCMNTGWVTADSPAVHVKKNVGDLVGHNVNMNQQHMWWGKERAVVGYVNRSKLKEIKGNYSTNLFHFGQNSLGALHPVLATNL